MAVFWISEMDENKLDGSDFGTVNRQSIRPVDDQPYDSIIDEHLPIVFVAFDGQPQMLVIDPTTSGGAQ